MSKFVAIIFPDEAKAYEGTRALKDLHRDGSLVLYSEAVVVKDAEGKLSIKEVASGGALGTAIGALTGGLVGLIAGPIGAVAGLAGGALIGSFKDIFDAGVSADFIRQISGELTPGKTAVVAEIGEEWVTPLDARVSTLGGVVIRAFRNDVEDEQIEREVAATKVEFDHLQEEYERAGDKAKDDLKSRVDGVRKGLQAAADRAKAKAESLRKEAEAKIETLQEQASAVADDSKKRIDQRIAEVREEYKRRSDKLEKAWDLTKDALG